MKDFSFWKEYDGVSEGSGRSEKVWLINPDTGQSGLFKYKKDVTTTDHISECIAYQVASLIGIPCAKFELGIYCGREGSMSYNIIQDGNESLIEGINFINFIYPNYNPEKFKDMKSGEMYSIEMIEKVVKGFVEFEQFLKIPIFDYLIGNTDRHQSNWAVLWDEKMARISPLYDNSSSLCAYLSAEQVKGYLGKDSLRWRSLVETKSKSILRRTLTEEKRPTHLQVMEYIKDNYYAQTLELIEKIIEVMTEKSIHDILNQYEEELLSSSKKIVIRKFLFSKVEDIRHLYFGKEE